MTTMLLCWRCGGTGREPDDPARRCTVCGGVGDVDESPPDEQVAVEPPF